MNRALRLALNVLVSGAILAYLIVRVDFVGLLDRLRSGDMRMFVGAFVLIWLTHAAQVARWHFLIEAESQDLTLGGYMRRLATTGDARLTLAALFRYHLIGNFFQLFLPSTASADVVKGYFSVRGASNRGAPLAAIAVGRILGIVCAVVVAMAAVWAVRDPHTRHEVLGNPALWIAVVGIAFGVGLLLQARTFVASHSRVSRWMTAHRVGRLLIEVTDSFGLYRRRWRALGWGFVLSVTIHLLMIATSYAVFVGLGWKADIMVFTIYLPLVYLYTALPISFNGIGVREALFVYFLSSYGCTNELVIGYAVVGYSMVFAVGVAGWVIYLLERKPHGAPRSASSERSIAA